LKTRGLEVMDEQLHEKYGKLVNGVVGGILWNKRRDQSRG
jgi:hypothetical protein